jgi:hypothetical protein
MSEAGGHAPSGVTWPERHSSLTTRISASLEVANAESGRSCTLSKPSSAALSAQMPSRHGSEYICDPGARALGRPLAVCCSVHAKCRHAALVFHGVRIAPSTLSRAGPSAVVRPYERSTHQKHGQALPRRSSHGCARGTSCGSTSVPFGNGIRPKRDGTAARVNPMVLPVLIQMPEPRARWNQQPSLGISIRSEQHRVRNSGQCTPESGVRERCSAQPRPSGLN